MIRIKSKNLFFMSSTVPLVTFLQLLCLFDSHIIAYIIIKTICRSYYALTLKKGYHNHNDILVYHRSWNELSNPIEPHNASNTCHTSIFSHHAFLRNAS
ncbi:hypothetical protein Hanom_Chr03g00250751 [Helianthus anomalus]